MMDILKRLASYLCIISIISVTNMCTAGVAVLVQTEESNSNLDVVSQSRPILVLGGNGMLGSSTVDRLIRSGYNVTIANRGNWYWDSKSRILPYVRRVHCDRENITSCELLKTVVQEMKESNERFSAVVDFSARGAQDIRDTVSLLSGAVELYIYISSDSVYEVSEPSVHEGHREPGFGCREEEAVRPGDPNVREILSNHYQVGNRKFECEEELIRQRHDETSIHRIPYVILRLPDVIGARDTTYRFWIYQLWIRLHDVIQTLPVTMPSFLVNYNNSFVYADDVATLITDYLLDRTSNKHTIDQVFNVAWPMNITVPKLLQDIARELKLDRDLELVVVNEPGSLYLYPTARRGPINSSRVRDVLGWQPTDWMQAVRETVQFYEEAMKKEEFETQRNEIVQMIRAHLFPENSTELYEALEKIYDIDLNHFKPREEL